MAEIDLDARYRGTQPVQERHRFDEASLDGYLREHLPGYAAPLSVREFRGGQSNPTYELECGGARYVLRRKPPGVLLKSAHAVDREYRVIHALNRVDYPVPLAALLCEDAEVIGTPFYLMERVEGRVLWDPLMPACSPAERRAILESLTDTLAQLHTTDYAAIGLGDFGRPGNYFARQISRWSKQYQASETERVPEMDRLIDWLPQNIPPDESTTLVHGDFKLDNTIVHPTEPRILAVLDWELSTTGHPLGDLTYSLSLRLTPGSPFAHLGDDELRERGIPTADETVARYCQHTGRSGIESLDFYYAYNVFRSACILQGILGRVRDGTAASQHAADQGSVRPIARRAADHDGTLPERVPRERRALLPGHRLPPRVRDARVRLPRQLIVYDKAGERILEDLQVYAEEKIREERIAGKLSIFKNNTDFVGNSYGCHENYLVDRDVDFYYLAEQLIPFLVTRQIYTGAGKVFQTQDGVHYCISQRAQHIYQKISGTTTNDRSIINTRDEPHADREKYRRLHVIVGDSNMSEYTNFLKIGCLRRRPPDDRGQLHQQGLHAAQPGEGDQGHLLRHDLQAQAAARQRPRVLADRDPARVLRDGAEVHRAVPGLRRAQGESVGMWQYVLDCLDDDPDKLDRKIDWVIKRKLIESYRSSTARRWNDPRVFMLDLQYHDIRVNRGLYYLLERKGAVDRVLTTTRSRRRRPSRRRIRGRGCAASSSSSRARTIQYDLDWSNIRLGNLLNVRVICNNPFETDTEKVAELVRTIQKTNLRKTSLSKLVIQSEPRRAHGRPVERRRPPTPPSARRSQWEPTRDGPAAKPDPLASPSR